MQHIEVLCHIKQSKKFKSLGIIKQRKNGEGF